MILFGGLGFLKWNDTWAYDPVANTWTDLEPTGELPPGRGWYSMAFDAASGKMVLFGGWEGRVGSLGDMWAYDPGVNDWSRLNPAGHRPSKRLQHCMIYDPVSARIIMFGGWSGSHWFNDLWALSAQSAAGPADR
jgi:N-acetylneuraminic acid mutarotase